MLQTSSNLQMSFSKEFVKEDASNQLQPQDKLSSKDWKKEAVSNQLRPPNELFLKDLRRTVFRTSSSLQTSSPKALVKENASNQLQPDMKLF